MSSPYLVSALLLAVEFRTVCSREKPGKSSSRPGEEEMQTHRRGKPKITSSMSSITAEETEIQAERFAQKCSLSLPLVRTPTHTHVHLSRQTEPRPQAALCPGWHPRLSTCTAGIGRPAQKGPALDFMLCRHHLDFLLTLHPGRCTTSQWVLQAAGGQSTPWL